MCKSRSKLNSHASANLGCIQDGSDQTGQSWVHVSSYIKRHRPSCVVLECVSDLDQHVPETGMSDTEFIVLWLEQNNYGAVALKVDATAYGSLARRDRIFWVGFAGKQDRPDLRLASVQRYMDSLRIGVVAGIDSYLVPTACHQSRAKVPKDASEKDFKYKDDHARLYDIIGLQWPPERGAFDKALDHMPARQYEVVVLCDHAFPFPRDSNKPHYLECEQVFDTLDGSERRHEPMVGNSAYLDMQCCGRLAPC